MAGTLSTAFFFAALILLSVQLAHGLRSSSSSSSSSISELRHRTIRDPPSRPRIPLSYSANYTVTADVHGVYNISGDMFVNHDTRQYLINITGGMFRDYILHVQHYCNGTRGSHTLNGQCRVPEKDMGGGRCYFDFFDWVPYSNFTGLKIFSDGTFCNEWSGTFGNTYVSVCVDYFNANLPIRFKVVNFNPITRASSPFAFHFSSFKPTLKPHEIPPPGPCSSTPYSCPPGPVINRTLWRLHNKLDYSLPNKNVADLTGDAAFYCIFVNENNTDFLAQSIFSMYQTQLNSTWSQYSLCNAVQPSNATSAYRCEGAAGQQFQVGRETAFAAAPHSGQCAPRDGDIGVWFSLLASAEGTSGWQDLGRVKSINASCLINDALRTACGRFDFKQAVKAMEKSFAACSDVPPPPSSKPREISVERVDAALEFASSPLGSELSHSLGLALNSTFLFW